MSKFAKTVLGEYSKIVEAREALVREAEARGSEVLGKIEGRQAVLIGVVRGKGGPNANSQWLASKDSVLEAPEEGWSFNAGTVKLIMESGIEAGVFARVRGGHFGVRIAPDGMNEKAIDAFLRV